MPEPTRQQSLSAIGHVISYLAGRWYETEYGQVEWADRWYQPAELYMERISFAVRDGEAAPHYSGRKAS